MQGLRPSKSNPLVICLYAKVWETLVRKRLRAIQKPAGALSVWRFGFRKEMERKKESEFRTLSWLILFWVRSFCEELTFKKWTHSPNCQYWEVWGLRHCLPVEFWLLGLLCANPFCRLAAAWCPVGDSVILSLQCFQNRLLPGKIVWTAIHSRDWHSCGLYPPEDDSFLLTFLLLSFLESITLRVFTSFNTCFVLGVVHVLYLMQLTIQKRSWLGW